MSKLAQKSSLDPDSGEAASAAKPVRDRRSRADAVGNETIVRGISRACVVTTQEVQERLDKLLDKAQETPMAITKQDKPVAVLLSVQDYERLQRNATEKPVPPANLYESIRSRLAATGGFELEIPPRGPMREPPSFD